MGNLTIRNLDDGVIETLKAQAKANQRSLEAEVRYVLTQQADQRVRMADFRKRTASILAMTAKSAQTDSAELLREDRERPQHPKPSLVEFLRASPLAGVELDIERDRSLPRNIEL